MRYDIKAMRQQAEATPGKQVAVGKEGYLRLLDAVERGQSAEDDLAKVRGLLLGGQSTAIAA